jgi:hypothetical protein
VHRGPLISAAEANFLYIRNEADGSEEPQRTLVISPFSTSESPPYRLDLSAEIEDRLWPSQSHSSCPAAYSEGPWRSPVPESAAEPEMSHYRSQRE